MPTLLSVRELEFSHGSEPLFTGLSLSIDSNERLAVIGPNGAGKSTLLNILAGDLQPDKGERSLRKDVVLATVRQQDQFPDGSVTDVLQHAVKELPDHERDAAVAQALSLGRFDDADKAVNALSGGWRKRLSICAALIKQPELVLFDEPTNHLDLDGVLWLEDLLRKARFACVVVSHDRWFINRVATRVVEINARFNDGCFAAAGDYTRFLQYRADHIEAMRKQQASLANRHRREQAWLARQPKARTTKNAARIKEAQQLGAELAELSSLNKQERSAGITFTASGRQTQDLILAEGLSCDRGGQTLFANMDLQLGPGQRLGLLGRNGSGKSSLLQIFNGSLKADAGKVKLAHELRVATFEQTRASLDQNSTLLRALAPNGKTVHFRGREQHVNAWADRFLFDRQQLDQQVSSLSGGEQARLLIAQLMLMPADVLLLDEPTNDLDIPALEVLEQSLIDFPGAVILISHDRYLLDEVCTSFIGLDGDGSWRRCGDYQQWETGLNTSKSAKSIEASTATDDATPASKATGLSYEEQKELRNLPAKLDKAEQELSRLDERLGDPELYADTAALQRCQDDRDKQQTQIDLLYERWQELDARNDSST